MGSVASPAAGFATCCKTENDHERRRLDTDTFDADRRQQKIREYVDTERAKVDARVRDRPRAQVAQIETPGRKDGRVTLTPC
jgi:hypothetical protein